ncbi:DUF4386 domain-containing protein [Flavitalea antarctica]
MYPKEPGVYPKKKLAQIAGLFYLIVISTGLFAEIFVRQKLRIHGDPLEIANHLRNSEMLSRLGLVADLVNFICGLPVILIVYILFEHVNKFLIRLALLFVIIQTAIIATNLLNQISPLLLLGNNAYMKSFEPGQLAALSMHALDLQAQGYGIGLVFFGCYCIIVGYLIMKSTLVPRFLGFLYALAGISYLANTFIMIMSRDFANPLFPYFAAVAFVGEFSLCLWLLIKGVKDQQEIMTT